MPKNIDVQGSTWAYFTTEELVAQKNPSLNDRLENRGAFWAGLWFLGGVLVTAKEGNAFMLSLMSAGAGVAFYMAHSSLKVLVEASVCRIHVNGQDLGARLDTGELEDFLFVRFPGADIQIERSNEWKWALPPDGTWKRERRITEREARATEAR